MNLREFGELKAGDKIENPMLPGNVGTITKVLVDGVQLTWRGSDTPFTFTAVSTAWMHWSKINETKPDDATPASPPTT